MSRAGAAVVIKVFLVELVGALQLRRYAASLLIDPLAKLEGLLLSSKRGFRLLVAADHPPENFS